MSDSQQSCHYLSYSGKKTSERGHCDVMFAGIFSIHVTSFLYVLQDLKRGTNH